MPVTRYEAMFKDIYAGPADLCRSTCCILCPEYKMSGLHRWFNLRPDSTERKDFKLMMKVFKKRHEAFEFKRPLKLERGNWNPGDYVESEKHIRRVHMKKFSCEGLAVVSLMSGSLFMASNLRRKSDAASHRVSGAVPYEQGMESVRIENASRK